MSPGDGVRHTPMIVRSQIHVLKTNDTVSTQWQDVTSKQSPCAPAQRGGDAMNAYVLQNWLNYRNEHPCKYRASEV